MQVKLYEGKAWEQLAASLLVEYCYRELATQITLN
jgi:hypothetical protein